MSSRLMLTHTGLWVDPWNLRKVDVDIKDIAHALANTCRYAGQAKDFYSVAQHSVEVALCCHWEIRLLGLLHDAAEAYLGDMPASVKWNLPNYRGLERRVLCTILDAFGVPNDQAPELVKMHDRAVMEWERCFLFPGSPAPKYNRPVLVPLLPREAEQQFLAVFHALRR